MGLQATVAMSIIEPCSTIIAWAPAYTLETSVDRTTCFCLDLPWAACNTYSTIVASLSLQAVQARLQLERYMRFQRFQGFRKGMWSSFGRQGIVSVGTLTPQPYIHLQHAEALTFSLLLSSYGDFVESCCII